MGTELSFCYNVFLMDKHDLVTKVQRFPVPDGFVLYFLWVVPADTCIERNTL